MSEQISPATWRTWTWRVLVGVFVLSLVASTYAIWANTRVQDSTTWAETVAPLASDDSMQAFVVDQAMIRVDAQIKQDEDAGLLRNLTRSQLSPLIRVLLEDFVASPSFAGWWIDANQLAHGALMRVVNGDESDFLLTDGGDLVLNLSPAIDWVNAQSTRILPGSGYLLQLAPERTTFVLYSSDVLATLTKTFAYVDVVSAVAPVVMVVSLAAAIVLAHDRMRALGQIALATAAGAALMLVIINQWIFRTVDSQSADYQAALSALLRIVTVDLLSAFRWIAVAGLIIAGVIIVAERGVIQQPRVRSFLHNNRDLLVSSSIGISTLLLVLFADRASWIAPLAIIVIAIGVISILRGRDNDTPQVTNPVAQEIK